MANATQPDNSHRADLEKANSNFDNRHRFVMDFGYEMPNFAKSHPRIGEGWQINGDRDHQSGSPFHRKSV